MILTYELIGINNIDLICFGAAILVLVWKNQSMFLARDQSNDKIFIRPTKQT